MADGAPEPLGVTVTATGVNVAVAAPDATAIEFCLFDATGTVEVARHRLPGRIGAVWHGHVAGVAPGARYGLEAHGPWDPGAGHRFNPAKLLVDPWATRLDRPFRLHPALFDTGARPDGTDSAPHLPKAVVGDRCRPPRCRRCRPGRGSSTRRMSRGFTMRHPAVPEAIRGTFAGLAHPAAIAHLQALGVTRVELLPVAAGIDERHLPPLGLTNYWGYNPVAFLVPARSWRRAAWRRSGRRSRRCTRRGSAPSWTWCSTIPGKATRRARPCRCVASTTSPSTGPGRRLRQ